MAATARTLFDSVPRQDTFTLFENGHPDGQKVAHMLNYKKNDIAIAAGVPVSSVRYDRRMPSVLRERFTEWAVAINLVGNFFEDEHKTILWFKTRNHLLGNVSPAAMIRAGRFKKLMKFIQTALGENKR